MLIPSAIKKSIITTITVIILIIIAMSVYRMITAWDNQNRTIQDLTTKSVELSGQVVTLHSTNQKLAERLDQIKIGMDQYAKDIEANKQTSKTLTTRLSKEAIREKASDPVAATKLVNIEFNSYLSEINRETSNK